MPDDVAPIAIDSVARDLFGLILCARPGEAAELRQLAGLPPGAGTATAAAELAIGLQARMGEGEAGQADFARRVLGQAARPGETMAELDAALLTMRGAAPAVSPARSWLRRILGRPAPAPDPAMLAGDGRIALLLAGIRTRLTRRAGRWGQPVAWPALADQTQPATPFRLTQAAMQATAMVQVAGAAAEQAASAAGHGMLSAATAALDMSGLTHHLSTQTEVLQAKMGKVNILIAGRSGVGKSTLINTIFGREVARTGLGRPVTDSIAWYEPDGLPVRLCDTRGLELARYQETLGALRDEIRSGPIHILWLCIAEPSGRIEEAEREVLALCRAQAIPAIAVLTKAFLLDDMSAAARQELPGVAEVIRVMAVGADGAPPRGIVELVQATQKLLAGAPREAFNAAQQVDIDAKRGAALKIAAGAAATAGLAAATPVPLADSAGVLTINIGMVAGIAVAMGVPLSRANMMPVATSIVGALAVTFGARMLAGSILKLIPGVGSIAGGAINAGLASSATYGLGHGFTEYLCRFFRREHRMPAGEELARGFAAFWQKWDHKKDAPPAGQG